MENNKYKPYNFDFKFQYRTYKNIGIRHKNQFMAKKMRYRIYETIRNLNNKDERKYKNFDTFSQWRRYIEEEFKGNLKNYDDLKHYLQKRKDDYEFLRNVSGTIVVPIYVCMITMELSVYTTEGVDPIFTIISVFAYLITLCLRQKYRYNFYRDFIKILNQE